MTAISAPAPPSSESPAAAATWQRRGGARRLKERIIEAILLLAALSSVAITIGNVWTLIRESLAFFAHVGLWDFLTDTQWTPLFADTHYGILPLLSGTLVSSRVALLVTIPLGTVIAI
jgi:phosphate transport system permease protein